MLPPVLSAHRLAKPRVHLEASDDESNESDQSEDSPGLPMPLENIEIPPEFDHPELDPAVIYSGEKPDEALRAEEEIVTNYVEAIGAGASACRWGV